MIKSYAFQCVNETEQYSSGVIIHLVVLFYTEWKNLKKLVTKGKISLLYLFYIGNKREFSVRMHLLQLNVQSRAEPEILVPLFLLHHTKKNFKMKKKVGRTGKT